MLVGEAEFLAIAKLHRVSKKLCIFVSVRTLSNFNKFWYVDGKVAETVCYMGYTFPR